MTDQNIELHIENLVFHGINRVDQGTITQIIQQELNHVLLTKGLPQTLHKPRTVSELNAGEFRMKQGEQPNRIGRQVAQKIYQGFGK